jgi:hypothetical protein
MGDVGGPALILAGFGTSSQLQLTVEAQQMVVHAGRALSLGIPERLRALLVRQGVVLTELDYLLEAATFAERYARVAQAVLAHAQQDPPAMFISQGSPLFGNAITRYLVAEAARLKIPVRTFPAVSPIEVVVAEIGLDVGRAGLQTISARGLVARPLALNPYMPLLLLELAGLSAEGGSAEAYGPLVATLMRAYPASQPVTLINMQGDGRISRATVTLGKFVQVVSKIEPSSCLFVDIRQRATTSEKA